MNTFVDLKTMLRDSTAAEPPVTTPVIDIKSMAALDSVYVLLRPTSNQRTSPDISGIEVDNPSAGATARAGSYVAFYYDDYTHCYYTTACPNPLCELGAFAKTPRPR